MFAAVNSEPKKSEGQRSESAPSATGAASAGSINATWTMLALGAPTLAPLEHAFSADLSDVRVHVAPDVARARGTEAVTMGRDVYLARPMPLDAPAGRTVLAHEMAHVVQQRRGGTTAAAGTGDATLEAEAGRVAEDVVAGRHAEIQGAARFGAPQHFTTKEGDQLPDPIIVDWSERFQITFATRTTGYGDVKMQYKFHYLGSFRADPDDLDFTMERDPGGPWVMGTPHSRRINAKITEFGSESIKVDVYGDGTVIHYLWHTIEWSQPLKRELHRIELDENSQWAGHRLLTSIDTQGVQLRPEAGLVGTVATPTFKPDPDNGPQLPTGMLLDMIVARLNALNVPISAATWMLRIKLDADMKAATQAGDDEGVTRNARRLLDLLTYLGPVFPMLEEMGKPEQYLGDLASVATEEVDRITDLYVEAMLEAYSPPGETPSLAEADKAMAAFPDWIKFLYLRDDRGVKSLISQIPGLVKEVYEIRASKGRVWLDTPITNELLGSGDLAGELGRRRESAEIDWRREGPDVLDSIQLLYAKVQHAIGLLTAIIWAEQLSAIYYELDASLINAGMEKTFWGERTERAHKYSHQLQMLVLRLSGIKIVYGSGYNLSDKSDKELIADALKELSDLGSSEQFQKDLDDFGTRIKWVNRIAFLGKLALIIAAAALTGGSAGSLAFAGLRAVGASVAVATAGELVIGGLVFTAVSRGGQQIMFGKVEGNFFVDWFWNTVTLGVLKAANYGFLKVFKLKGLDPNVAKIRFGLGRTATAMISLHGIAEVQHLAMTGKPMTNDERVNAIFQNVALMVGLEAGRFITAPLEARLTETLISKLKIDVKLRARIDSLAAQRKPLIASLEALSRGEAGPAEIEKTLQDVEKLWAEELKLVDEGFSRKVLTEEELTGALSAYAQHIGGMQLRLSQLGIEAPMPGGTMFRPIQRGVVAFTPEAQPMLEKFYKPDPADPSTAGKSLKESDTMPGVLEGRLPNGELTFYVPEGAFPQGIPKSADIIAARDAAVLAAKGDAKAAQGLARLNEGLKGAGPTAKGFSQKNVDAILGSVPVELIPEFLRAMADPAFTIGPRTGLDFFTGIADHPAAIDFARVYGGSAVIKIYRLAGSWTTFDTLLLRAETALESAETPAARQEFIDDLLKGDKAALDKILDPKVKLPRETPVSKKTLGVNRSSTEWLAKRKAAGEFADDHSVTATPKALDLIADLLQIHAKAMNRKFEKWSGNQDAIENLLDRFDALVADVAKEPVTSTDPAKTDPAAVEAAWKTTLGNWRNSLRGAIGEAVGRPPGVPKYKGPAMGKVVGGKLVDPTIPDYSQTVAGVVEWVNIKSDVLAAGLPGPRSGTYSEGVAAASNYRKAATKEAGNLPAGDKYSIQFLRDPLRADDPAAGRRTRRAMLDTLFDEGSPIYRVKFGNQKWITRADYLAEGK